MVLQARERVEAALREAITQQCKMGFPYHTSLSISAKIEVTIDDNTTVSMSITDNVNRPKSSDTSELGDYLSNVPHAKYDWQPRKDHELGARDKVRFVELSSEHRQHHNDETGSSGVELKGSDKNGECPDDNYIFEVVCMDDGYNAFADNTDDMAEQRGNDLADAHAHEKTVKRRHEDHMQCVDVLDGGIENKNGKQIDGDVASEMTQMHVSGDVHSYKKDKLYSCPFCEFSTSHGSALSRHLIIHSKTKHKCDKCSEVFSCATDLKTHIQSKHKNLPCRHCGMVFPSRLAVSIHIRKCREKQKPQVCATQSEHIQRSQDKGKVKAGFKGLKGSGFQCFKCDKKFSRKLLLKKHLKAECTNEKRSKETTPKQSKEKCEPPKVPDCKIFKCSGCDFSTLQRKSLERHLKMTSFKCEFCSEKFICKIERKTHMEKFHPVESKKKICEFCSKEFHSRQGLYTHRKVMHSEGVNSEDKEIFTCHVCGKAFPVHSYLTRHLKAHDSAEPYKCPKCHRTFKYHRNFKSHKDGCINTSGYPCHICGKVLKTEYTLRIHIRGMHSDNKLPFVDPDSHTARQGIGTSINVQMAQD